MTPLDSLPPSEQNNKTTIETKSKKSVISELKSSTKSLSKELKNKERGITSEKIINLASEKLTTSESLMKEEKKKLKNSWNPLSKATLYLAENHNIYLGKLKKIHQIYNKCDEILGRTRQGIENHLRARELYIEDESELEGLKEKLPINSVLVTFSPYKDSDGITKQYLKGIALTKEADGEVKKSSCPIFYKGDKDGVPQFLATGKELSGIDELVQFMAGEENKEKSKYTKNFLDSPEEYI